MRIEGKNEKTSSKNHKQHFQHGENDKQKPDFRKQSIRNLQPGNVKTGYFSP